MYHKPVLLHETVSGLNIDPQGIYVDVTFGGGGHARAILNKLDDGRLIAFDQDLDAAINAPEDQRFTLIPQNFRYMRNFLMLHNAGQVDGILADLGVSSHQIDKAEKGFSTRFDGKLDMRMDQNNPLDAKTIVNDYEEEELKGILAKYGEIQHAGRMANAICNYRSSNQIISTLQLKDAIGSLLPRGKENKLLAQLFQALRIEVNQEIEVLKTFLIQTVNCLKPGGRLVIISYHSLEDRLVKNFMKSGNFEGEVEKDFYGNPITPFKVISRKVIVASENEVEQNSRARSARMRIAEKK
jgi:16S rRNA (cytosine1402-N4)-methyltransferase